MSEQKCPLCGDAFWQGDDGASIANAVAAREPLVQEVIRLHKAAKLLAERGAPDGLLLDAGRNIQAALDKLAEWKP